jgi:hypothetical protein
MLNMSDIDIESFAAHEVRFAALIYIFTKNHNKIIWFMLAVK